MIRGELWRAVALVACGATLATAQTPPTVAVVSFGGGSLSKPGDYASLGRGITELLVTGLAANTGITIVERGRLDQVLAEQALSARGQVDPATAVRIGKLFGAKHFVTGSFLVDSKDRIRLDITAMNVETSQREYGETLEGRMQDLFDMVAKLERKVGDAMKLRFATPPAKLAGKGDEQKALTLYGQAAKALDKGDTTAALTGARAALAAHAGLKPAQAMLDALTKKPPLD